IRTAFPDGSAPVALGLVASLNRRGGNATGVHFPLEELVAKRLGMLREVAPSANRFVALVNPDTAFTDAVVKELQTSASEFGLPIEIFRASTGREIDAAFANLAEKPGGALLVGPDAVFCQPACANRHAGGTSRVTNNLSHARLAEIGGLIATGQILRMRITRPAYMWAASSKARSQRTCRSYNRPNSS